MAKVKRGALSAAELVEAEWWVDLHHPTAKKRKELAEVRVRQLRLEHYLATHPPKTPNGRRREE